MNVAKLKSVLVERGSNVESLAKSMGLSRSSLYRKFNGSEKITVEHIQKIKQELNLTDADIMSIFFDK